MMLMEKIPIKSSENYSNFDYYIQNYYAEKISIVVAKAVLSVKPLSCQWPVH